MTQGEYFIVEMQKAVQKYFNERAVFYGSTGVAKQGRKGKKWQYAIKTVYFFGILDFEYDTDTQRWGKRKLVRKFTLKDENGIELSNKLQISYLQLPFFKKRRHQLITRFDKWCYFLKNLEDFDKIPNIINEPIFMKALSAAKLSKMDVIDYLAYTKQMNNAMDTELAMEYAAEQAMTKGRTLGREEGITLGIEEGRVREARLTVFRLRYRGAAIDFLVDISKLPYKDVENLIKGYDEVYAKWLKNEDVESAEHLLRAEIPYLIDLFNENQN